MKQYDKLLSFGCSFTQGAGLNSPEYHRWLKKHPPNEYGNYMYANAYPTQLAKMLNCEVENHGVPRASNDLIFKNVYEHTKDIKDGSNILVTMQTTLLPRIMIYSNQIEDFVTVNNLEIDDKNIKRYYTLYQKYFYNRTVVFNTLMKNIDLYTVYLQNKKIDVLWILYDADEVPDESKTMMTFDNIHYNIDLCRYISTNKYRLLDLPNYPIDDSHFSVDGHRVVAEHIHSHLGKYYD